MVFFVSKYSFSGTYLTALHEDKKPVIPIIVTNIFNWFFNKQLLKFLNKKSRYHRRFATFTQSLH